MKLTQLAKILRTAKSKLARVAGATKITAIMATVVIFGGGIAIGIMVSPKSTTDTKNTEMTKQIKSDPTDTTKALSNKSREVKEKNNNNTNKQGEKTTVSKPSSTNRAPAGQTPQQAPQSKPTTPRADYNLNETWLLSSVGIAGVYNRCWPTKITESNASECEDHSHSLSNFMLYGIGVSKNSATAISLAEKDAQQKADAAHIDVRRGGSDDPTPLTEALCRQYSLSCGRW